MKTPQRVLVVVTRRIGDVLLATPLIRSLRRAWPDARIDALVFSGTEGVLAANPDLHRVITVAQRPGMAQHLRLLFALWRRYDLALSAVPSDRPTLYAAVAGKRSVGLVAAGAKHHWKRRLLTQSATFDETDMHTVLTYLKLADLLDIPRCHEVVAAWNEADAAQVCDILGFNPSGRKFTVLHVYPMFTYKAWHRDGWVELAQWFDARGVSVVLTGGGGAEELSYIRELLPLLPRSAASVAGKLSLGGVAYLLHWANAYVGPDTAVTHLAAAVGTPTVALFGPSNPVKWGPWPKGYAADRNPYRMRGTQRVNNVVLLQGEGDCVPCLQEGCARHIKSLSDCLQQLPAARVVAASEVLLQSGAPPTPDNI